MLFLRFVLLLIGFGFLAGAAGLVLYDLYLSFELDRLLRRDKGVAAPLSSGETPVPPPTSRVTHREIRWSDAARVALMATVCILAGDSIVVVPDGHAGIRISQISGVRPGTMYAGMHFIFPLFDRVELFDIRDRVFSTSATEAPHEKLETLTVEAREGLSVGLAVTVR